MAQRKQDFLGNVIGRISELPGAKGLLDSIQGLGERLDDMQKRVRGLEKMEKRLADVEKRVKALEAGRSKPATRRSTTPRKTPSTKASGASTPTSTKAPGASTPTPPPTTPKRSSSP